MKDKNKKLDLTRSVPPGTFSQSMVVVRGNILLLLAGYAGTMTNAVYAYTAPLSLALNNVRKRECQTFPEFGPQRHFGMGVTGMGWLRT